jgi:hypothetical protein
MQLTMNRPAPIEGEIELEEFPQHLGPITDTSGQRWDIHGIFRNGNRCWVQAVPENQLHPYYTDTSSGMWCGVVSQTWKPYLVRVKGVMPNEPC